MIYFCYFCPKNFFSTLGVAHDDPFSVQIGSKKTIFERFYQLFFRTPGLQHKLLIWIVSPNIFHWKSARKSKVGVVFGVQCCKKKQRNWYFNGVFFIFCMRYTFTSKKVVVIEIPEWKLKTILARNIIFEGDLDKIFAHFSQPLSHILGNNITSVFLRDWKFKFCLRNSIFWPFWGQKWQKKALSIPATSLPTLFSLKEKFLRVIVF